MKCSIMMCAVMLVAQLLANSIMLPSPPKRGMPQFKSEKARENFMRMSGGYLEVTLPGKPFMFLDLRKDLSVGISDFTKGIGNSSRILTDYSHAEMMATPYQSGRFLIDSGKAAAVAVVYEGDVNDPVLVAYPENRMATINVTPLKHSNYAKRLERELWRAYVYAAGGTTSPTEMCVMQPVLTLKDLDEIQCDMAFPGMTGQIVSHASKYGFAKIMKGTYRGACKMGWAPPPTNDYQKAIWESVKKEKAEATKEPTSPMRIKFDKKKGK